MSDSRIFEFLRREGPVLVSIGALVFVLAIGINEISRILGLTLFTYSDVADLILAIVAVTSLYIAWRELVRKVDPNVLVRFEYQYPDNNEVREHMCLKLTNSGESVVTPFNSWYYIAERIKGGYTFSKDTVDFEDDALQSGETSQEVLGKDIVLLKLETINISDWRGDVVTIEEFPQDKQVRNHLMKGNSRNDVKLQKLFNDFVAHPYISSLKVDDEEIMNKKYETLTDELGLSDTDESSTQTN